MKKFLLLIVVGLFASLYLAQSQNMTKTVIDWGGIQMTDSAIIGVSFDIGGATFGGLSYKDRAQVDPELITDLPSEVGRCVSAANRTMKGRSEAYRHPQTIFFVYEADNIDVEFHLLFVVKSVDADGYTVADAIITTPTGVAKLTNLIGKGGRYGSFVNLMGDGFESLGGEIAKRLYDAKRKGTI